MSLYRLLASAKRRLLRRLGTIEKPCLKARFKLETKIQGRAKGYTNKQDILSPGNDRITSLVKSKKITAVRILDHWIFFHRPILYEIVQNNQHGYCQAMSEYFNFELQSDTVKRRTLKFESTFESTLVKM